MNIEGQYMETYSIFAVSMGNAKVTEEVEFHPTAPVLKYQARVDLDDTDVLKDSVSLSDNIVKEREYFVAPSNEIYKTTK